jgi:hypothetical protein
MNNTNQHFGSALDNLLEETGELAEISAVVSHENRILLNLLHISG